MTLHPKGIEHRQWLSILSKSKFTASHSLRYPRFNMSYDVLPQFPKTNAPCPNDMSLYCHLVNLRVLNRVDNIFDLEFQHGCIHFL